MTSVNQPSTQAPDYVVGAVHVWVKPPKLGTAPNGTTVYSYDWTNAWVEERRLIPLTSVESAGSMGTAQFKLLRRTREENGTVIASQAGNVVRGAYVCITAGIPQTYDSNGFAIVPTYDATKARWYGWITNIDATIAAGNPLDEMGSETAQQLGSLLDSTQLKGWAQEKIDSAYPSALATPPSANYSVADGIFIGNRSAVVAPDSSVFLFARRPSTCGVAAANYWTRYTLLQHILYYCRPQGLPNMSLSMPAAVQTYLDDATVPEVFELYGLTMKGAIDMLLPRARGIGWVLNPSTDPDPDKIEKTWVFTVYTHDPDGTYLVAGDGTKAPNTPQAAITSDPAPIAVVHSESAMDDYEEVIIRGERHVICGTVSYADDNLGAAWSSAQETAFRTCPGVIYPASPKPEDRAARNTEFRQGPGVDRVFSVFSIGSHVNPNGDILVRDMPGDGSGTPMAFFPFILWNAATKIVSINTGTGTNQQPYLPTTRVMRTLPWPKLVNPDASAGTQDRRVAANIAQPEYMVPRVFRYMASPPANDLEKWVNLSTHGNPNATAHIARNTPDVTSDDRSLALVVRFSPPEMLARNHWTTGVDALGAFYPDDPNANTATSPAMDWQTLVATIAVESDQRVEVSAIKPGVGTSGAFTRRTLVIQEPGLKFWFVWQNTILALKQDASGAMAPWRATSAAGINDIATAINAGGGQAGFITRNGYPTAQRFLDMVSAWVFRPRFAVTVHMARPDLKRSWAFVGAMLGTVLESTANTVVESVSTDWGVQSAGITVQTAVIERPNLPRIGGSVSATGGGGVSVSGPGGGGTLAQQIQAVAQTVDRLAAQKEPNIINAVPVGGGSSVLYTLQIDRGNTLSDGSTLGIKWASPAPTTVPSLYDPNVTSAFIDGIGRATLYINGVAQSGYVLVAHYTGNGSPLTLALVQNEICITTGATISLPLVSDSTKSVALYIPQSP